MIVSNQQIPEILEQHLRKEEVAQLIDSLCIKSMIAYIPNQNSKGRYDIQETVRLYLSELQNNSENQKMLERHAEYFTELASQWNHHMNGSTVHYHSEIMFAENENIIALMTLACSNELLRIHALRFSWYAGPYWIARGKIHEGKELIKQLLLESDKLSFREITTLDEARATTTYAHLENGSGNYDVAEEHLKRSLEFMRQSNDLPSKALTLGCYGSLLARTGRYELSIKALEEAIELFEEVGDKVNTARFLNNISTVYIYKERYAAALVVLKRASEMLYEMQLYRDVAINKGYLAEVYIYLKDYENSRVNLLESASFFKEQNEVHLLISSLETCYTLAFESGDYLAAAKMIAASLSYQQTIGLERSNSEIQRLHDYLNQICAKVSMHDFNKSYGQGENLSQDEFMEEIIAWLKRKNFSEDHLESSQVMDIAKQKYLI